MEDGLLVLGVTIDWLANQQGKNSIIHASSIHQIIFQLIHSTPCPAPRLAIP